MLKFSRSNSSKKEFFDVSGPSAMLVARSIYQSLPPSYCPGRLVSAVLDHSLLSLLSFRGHHLFYNEYVLTRERNM